MTVKVLQLQRDLSNLADLLELHKMVLQWLKVLWYNVLSNHWILFFQIIEESIHCSTCILNHQQTQRILYLYKCQHTQLSPKPIFVQLERQEAVRPTAFVPLPCPRCPPHCPLSLIRQDQGAQTILMIIISHTAAWPGQMQAKCST